MKNIFKKTKENNSPKIINKILIKHGIYSVAITAVFLAVVIAFNWLFVSLSEKYHWEIDMTPDKIHSMDKNNIKYLKSLDEEINIIVVAADKTEYAQVMSSWVPKEYQVYYGDEYYSQTANIVEKYSKYNDKINVQFIDSQSTEFTQINSKYSELNITYGDILVTHSLSQDEERIKKLTFDDIYNYSAEEYSSYSYVTSNNIENALTNAITYVISGEAKKAVLLTGHSANDNTSNYINLLNLNGYEVEINDDKLVSSIPADANIVAVLSASVDFYESELNVISQFLDNEGKLGKGFIYFADASSPQLPNLNAFMEEWGIQFKDGILFENDDAERSPNDASQLNMTLGTTLDTTGMKNGRFAAAYNVPMLTEDPDDSGTQYEVKNIVVTNDTAVIAPIGAANSWKPENEDNVGQYVGAAVCEKLSYDVDNNRQTSYVVAFSSVQFIQSPLAEFESSDNKDVVLYCTDLAANVTEGEVKFLTKTITTESYMNDVTVNGVKGIRAIFMIILPLATLALGVYVYIRRRID
ncbi:MAG: Gldg family protein [Clostridia bacterium]|nr:Gldg family protein [Clostridia bacterium]